MGLTVGQVEAILLARDQMSPVVVAAAQKVVDLTATLEQLGVKAGPAFDLLTERIEKANLNLEILAAGADAGVVSMQNLGGAMNMAGDSATQLERLATRMLERLAIFYALKGTFDFVEGLFTGASALEALNDQTGLTLDKLQRLQYEASESDVKFETVTKAADELNKKLAEMGPAANDALHDLGLNFETVFAMNPDERFDAIATAIEKLPNQLQRNKAEIALFGSDAIDPLIKKYGELTDKAKDFDGVLTDEQVKALDTVTRKFKDMWIEFQASMASGLVNMGTMVSQHPWFSILIGAKNFVSGVPLAATLTELTNMSGAKFPLSDIELPADKPSGSGGGGGTGGPLTGEARLQQLRNEADAWKTLSAVQLSQLAQLKDMGELNEKNAAAMGVTTTQYASYLKLLKDADELYKAQVKYWEEYNKELDKSIESSEKIEEQTAAAFAKQFTGKGAQQTLLDMSVATGQTQIGGVTGIKNEKDAAAGLINGNMLIEQAQKNIDRIWESHEHLNILSQDLGLLSRGLIDLGTNTKNLGQFGTEVSSVAGDVGHGLQSAKVGVDALKDAGKQGTSGFDKVLDGISGVTSILGVAGSVIGVVKDLFSNIGGPSKDELQTRSDRSAAGLTDTKSIQADEDALTQMGYTAQQAQKMVAAALDAKTPQAFAAAMVPINAALEKVKDTETKVTNLSGLIGAYENAGHVIPQSMVATLQSLEKMPGLTDAERTSIQKLVDSAKPDFDKLETTAEKYGSTLSQLGPKLAQGQLDQTAQGVYQDFKDLTNAGGEAGNVISAMHDKLQDLVQQALASGSSLPQFLKPLLDNLQGSIKDANGNIVDLTKLKFDNTPTTDGLDTMQTSLDDIQGTLKDLPDDVATLLNSIPNNPFANWQIPGVPTSGPAVPMAGGGAGRVTRPTLFLAGESGPEDFAFSGGGQSFSGSGGGDITVHTPIYLDSKLLASVVNKVNKRDYMTRARHKSV